MERVIALVDMNSFFASCHQAENPALEGKEVIVAGDPAQRTGIVLACSYPCKAKGVKTGMAVGEARVLCPDAHYFKPDYRLYVSYSSRILAILRDFTDLVEPFSIDEAFLDLTGVLHLWGTPLETATLIKQRIRREAGLFCSVGLGPNKLVAKMAAGLQKPDGLTWLPTLEHYRRAFYHRPVRELFGVGSHYERHLRNYGIRTIGDLAAFPVQILKRRWGKNGETLWHCARGEDCSPVSPAALDVSRSIGQQKTLPRDVCTREQIRTVILELCQLVARRVRQGGYGGRTVSLTLRDSEFHFLTRSTSLHHYTDLEDDIYRAACQLLDRHWSEGQPVRLVGVTLGGLVRSWYRQPDLFGRQERQVRLSRACDAIKSRHGEKTIFRGVSLQEESLMQIKNNTLWEKHRLYLPQMREKAIHRCQDCKFFVLVQGREELRPGCVAGIRAYASYERPVPGVVPVQEIMRLVGQEGLRQVLQGAHPEKQSCGRFVLKAAAR